MFRIPMLEPRNLEQVNLISDESLPRIDYNEL